MTLNLPCRVIGVITVLHIMVQHSAQIQRQAQPLEDDSARTAPPGDRLALRADLAKVFRELKPRERTMIWLSCVEGESAAEIARAVGVGRASVPVLLFRARTKLARLLRRAGWEG